MSTTQRSSKTRTVADLAEAMESIAPAWLAQEWDNVGLVAGDPSATVRRVLLCVDMTAGVVDEALRMKADLILAYHPPIFTPIRALRADGVGAETCVFQCIHNGIAVYCTHTALDAADGGTNDVIASLCGIQETEALEHVEERSSTEFKLVVFVPAEHLESVADAIFNAGAGNIGDYSRCSYRLTGTGTFFGGEETDPAIGERGRMEYVDEVRLESVVPSEALPGVVAAIHRIHPYEEPAFDIYPLKAKPTRGIGRCGTLAPRCSLQALARRLVQATSAPNVQIVGPADRTVTRAVIVVGAAGSLPFRISMTSHDVIVTGEIRHHDALKIRRLDCTAIALGHWASERPVLAPLAQRLKTLLPGIEARVSKADRDPFRPIPADGR